MTLKSVSLAAAGALAFCAGAAGVSQAETMKVTADLTPSAEVPAAKSDGSGMLTGTYDPSTMKLTLTATYKDLTGPATMAHLHAPAPTGKDGPVEIPMKGPVVSPIKGDFQLTKAQAKNLTDGMTYFNVHTAANPGGEIRGQVLVGK